MRRLRQWLIRLTTSMTRRHDETRLREEIDDHVAFETDANLRRGLPPAEARRRALLTFGSMETFKENYRDQQGVPALEHLLQDVRIALRRMWKTPGFTAAAIATLALGLGLTSAVMSLAYALFLRPLPVDDAARVVFVEQTRVDRPGGWGYSYPDYLYLREHARAFDELAAHYSTSPMSVVTPGGPVSVTGAVVTANYFTLLRLTPRAGRFFSVDEDRVPGRDPVAILSYDFWRARFAEDPGVVGTTVRINGTAFTVIGIAPEHFHGIVAGLEPNAVWIPTAMFGVGYRYCDGLSRACGVVGVVGRLAGNTSIDQAHAEVAGLMRQLEAVYPEDFRGRGALVRPVRGVRFQEQEANAPIVRLLAVGGRTGLAGRLGKRRGAPAGARPATPEGDCGSPRDRRQPRPADPPAPGRVRDAGGRRRRGGAADRRLGDGGAASVLRRRRGRLAQPRPVAGPADRADWFRRRPVHRRGDRASRRHFSPRGPIWPLP